MPLITDAKALESLYRENQPLVHGMVVYCKAFVAPRHLQFEELEQEAALHCWKALRTYDSSFGTQVSTHIYNCVRNGLATYCRTWRKSGYQCCRESCDNGFNIAVDYPDLKDFEDVECFDNLLSCLDPKSKTIFRMIFVEGLQQMEVANQLNLSRQRLGQLYHRALRRLRERMMVLA